MWLWPLLVSCGGSPSTLTDCADADCRQDLVVAMWNQDPSAGAVAVADLPTPVERVAAVSRLVDLHPGETAELCDSLPRSASRERCERMNKRPHLWVSPPAPRGVAGRPGGGPAGIELHPSPARKSRFVDAGAGEPACLGEVDPHTCAWARAQWAAERGDGATAARLCTDLVAAEDSTDRWRAECHFTAAEAMVQSRQRAGYPEAVDLCLSTGPFRANCLAHTLILMARRAPPMDAAPGSAWKALRLSADTVARAWTGDPMAPLMVDRFWSEAMGFAAVSAAAVTGDALESVPEVAIPHVRAAAAARLLEWEDPAQHDLAAWVEVLGKALDQRSARLAAPKPEAAFKGAWDYWPEDVLGEETRPAVFYLGTSRRTVHEDRSADLAICLLEAAARLEPVADSLLQDGVTSTDPAVRWTARRLLERREGHAERPGATGLSPRTRGGPN